MNIRQHIEAGHYSKLGEHGAEIVPTTDKRTVRIADIDEESGRICGWLDGWHHACTWDASGRLLSNGASNDPSSPHLLPPPPRKVKAERVLLIYSDGTEIVTTEEHRAGYEKPKHCVPLTGEYEEAWS